MNSVTKHVRFIIKITTVLLLFFISVPVFTDNLAIKPEDTYIEYDENLGGFILAVRASPAVKSVMITESSADPEGIHDVYAYRTDEEDPLNRNEKRILNGYLLENSRKSSYLIDSTPESDAILGEAFRIFIPRKLVFGYPWSRNGETTVESGTWLNIRTFAKPYADYSGAWYDNPFTIGSNGAVVDEEGFTREIRDMIPDEIMEKLEESGMAIYSGNSPPNLEGTYFFSPPVLVHSSMDSDDLGHIFNDYYYSFFNQNNNDLTIEVMEKAFASSSVGTGTGGYIVGENGYFTIFVEIYEKESNAWSKVAEVISGELTNNGIKNFQLSLIMLDKSDTGNYIDVGEGRLVKDGDGFSERK